MIKEIFGKVVREIRLEKDLTQEKVAEIADLDRTFIYRIEQGLREPSLSTFFKISKGLQITPEELISRVEVNRKSEERKLKKKS